jgi:hypothetical protein
MRRLFMICKYFTRREAGSLCFRLLMPSNGELGRMWCFAFFCDLMACECRRLLDYDAYRRQVGIINIALHTPSTIAAFLHFLPFRLIPWCKANKAPVTPSNTTYTTTFFFKTFKCNVAFRYSDKKAKQDRSFKEYSAFPVIST